MHLASTLARLRSVEVPSPFATQTSVPSVNRPPSVVVPAPVDMTVPNVGVDVRNPVKSFNPTVQNAFPPSIGKSRASVSSSLQRPLTPITLPFLSSHFSPKPRTR